MGADGARKRKIAVIAALAAAVLLLALLELLVGSSGMSVRQCVLALFGSGDSAAVRIMQHIRLPRLLAAVIAGAGLSVSGLIMQTVLGNPMASPATLGVSNAAVFGANLSIIALSGGFLSTGNNLTSYTAGRTGTAGRQSVTGNRTGRCAAGPQRLRQNHIAENNAGAVYTGAGADPL